MKGKTIALIGGGALVAYLLYSKSKATNATVITNPAYMLPNSAGTANAAQNTALINAGASIINTAIQQAGTSSTSNTYYDQNGNLIDANTGNIIGRIPKHYL